MSVQQGSRSGSLVKLAAPDDKGGSDMHDEPRFDLTHTNQSGDAR